MIINNNSNIINFVKKKNKLGKPDNNDLFKRVQLTATMENSKEIPQKTKLELPYDPAIPFQGIYLKKNENTI